MSRARPPHQLPLSPHLVLVWLGVGEGNHWQGPRGIGADWGRLLEPGGGGALGTHRLSKGIVPQHSGGGIVVLAAMNDDNHRKGQGLGESKEYELRVGVRPPFYPLPRQDSQPSLLTHRPNHKPLPTKPKQKTNTKTQSISS